MQMIVLVSMFLYLAWRRWLKHKERIKEIECREKEAEEKTKRVKALVEQGKHEGDRKTDALENSVALSNKLKQKKEELFEQYENEVVKSLNEDSFNTSSRENAPVHNPSKGMDKVSHKKEKELLKIKYGKIKNWKNKNNEK